MTTTELLERINTIIEGIEGDRFTRENLNGLRKAIIAEGINN
jgi:hypothetical protein